MTGRVLYGCSVICILLAVYGAWALSVGFAVRLVIATIAFAAAGALLGAVLEIRDIMRKQAGEEPSKSGSPLKWF